MDNIYYDAVTKMENANTQPDYVEGWQSGYICNPMREEQRLTEAYEAGYEDGKEKNSDNFSKWVA